MQLLYKNLRNLQDSEQKLQQLVTEFKVFDIVDQTASDMVIATPVSNTDSFSEETLVGDLGPDGFMINSNSLESVPSLMSEVIVINDART